MLLFHQALKDCFLKAVMSSNFLKGVMSNNMEKYVSFLAMMPSHNDFSTSNILQMWCSTSIGVWGSAPSKPVCRDFGSASLQIGSKEFYKLGQKGAFLVHSAISKPKIGGFGTRPSWLVYKFGEMVQPKII